MAVVAQLFGVGLFSRLVTVAALLAESALPVYLLFDRQFERMQRKLFDATLKLKGITVEPLQQQDRQTLENLLAQHKQQRQQEQHQQQSKQNSAIGLISKLGSSAMDMAVRILLKPQPKEGLVMRKSRDLVTLATTVFIPFLVPLIAVRDSHAQAAGLLSRYWQQKGVDSSAGQNIIAQHLQWELRGFGLVAATLAYVPVLNWFMGLSNMVGAALLAADLERKQVPLLQKDVKSS